MGAYIFNGKYGNTCICKSIDLALIIDGWMTCNFSSFLTVFQLYENDERMIMKGCA